MNAKERFESLISYIEEQTTDKKNLTVREIADNAAEREGMQYRELHHVFLYLTGRSPINYVRERKMMHVYKIMGEMKKRDKLDMEKLIELSDYDNASSFSTGFKNVFGESPSDTYKNYDGRKYRKPLTWESLSECASHDFHIPQQRFGLTMDQISQYREAENLQLLYELSDKQSEYAYQMSLACDLPMKKAFDLCDVMNTSGDDLAIFIGPLDQNPQNWSPIHREQVHQIVELYEYCDLNFTELIQHAQDLAIEGRNIFDVWPEAFKYFIKQDYCSYSELESLLKEYKEWNPAPADCFDDFMYYVREYVLYDASSLTEVMDWIEGSPDEIMLDKEKYEIYRRDAELDMILDTMEADRMRRIEAESLYNRDPRAEYDDDLYNYMMYSD